MPEPSHPHLTLPVISYEITLTQSASFLYALLLSASISHFEPFGRDFLQQKIKKQILKMTDPKTELSVSNLSLWITVIILP
jgi:hypothetical protein